MSVGVEAPRLKLCFEVIISAPLGCYLVVDVFPNGLGWVGPTLFEVHPGGSHKKNLWPSLGRRYEGLVIPNGFFNI